MVQSPAEAEPAIEESKISIIDSGQESLKESHFEDVQIAGEHPLV